MSRLVDCWASSDEEDLPDINSLEKNPRYKKASVASISSSSAANTSVIVDNSKNAPSPKDLVPKSASKTRKVRRLGAATPAAGNLLLQPFDSAQDRGSPRRASPTKRSAMSKEVNATQPSLFDEEDDLGSVALPTLRTQGFRKLRGLGSLKDESTIFDDDSQMSAPRPVQRSLFDDEDEAPRATRAPRFRKARMGASFQGESTVLGEDSQSSLHLDDVPEVKGLGPEKSKRPKASVHTLIEAKQSPAVEVSDHEGDQDLLDAQLMEQFQAINISGDPQESEQKEESLTCVDSPKPSASLDDEESEFTNGDGSTFNSQDLSESSVLPTKSFHAADAPSILKPKKLDIMNRSAAVTASLFDKQPRPAASLFRPSIRPKAGDSSSLDLASELFKLRLDLCDSDGENATPPSPEKTQKKKRMVSLTKPIPKIGPVAIDDNLRAKGPTKILRKKESPQPALLKSPKKEDKKTFEAKKHSIASEFLQELDRDITQGKIAELSESTGGVKLVWSKTLNTTAGRANWKKETHRTKDSKGQVMSTTYKHNATIELAEKIIDDEERLLNTLAHEFCHLANFMITGMTTNPHGKEFKAWAAKTTARFADRGVNVTTKHTYDIDYKYQWDCTSCEATYKRHSKSIDTTKARCGKCKAPLKQTKPVPRGPTVYQTFVKEQMKIVKEENPGSPQKDVMRIIGEKWKARGNKSEDGDVVVLE